MPLNIDLNLTASDLTNVPAGNIAATNVQAAIDELDNEKLARDGSNANTDVDLGAFALNCKHLKINGTSGTGHIGLKHQSGSITAAGSESAFAADSNGNPIWKNDGNAIQNIAFETYAPYFKSTATPYTSSSTATNEVAHAFLIPRDTGVNGGMIELDAIFEANSSANTKIVRFYQSAAATLNGTEKQLAAFSFTTNSQFTPFYRRFYIINGTTIIGSQNAVNSVGDLGAQTTAPASNTINSLGSDSYFIVTVNRANAADTLIMRGASIRINTSR